MPKAPPSFQFYPADFLVGTAGLSHSSKATYLLLLCYEWTHVDLYFEPSKLAVMVGIERAQFDEDWSELSEKFTIDKDGFLRNERLETIRGQVVALSEARQKAGRKGGSSKARNLLLAKRKQKGSKGRLKTEDCRLKNNTGKQSADAFEQFWEIVPAKVAKARAKKHYETAIDEITTRGESDPHGFLLERMTAYAASDKAKGQYAWEPCSWLRDGHYDDDQGAWVQKHLLNGAPAEQPKHSVATDPANPTFEEIQITKYIDEVESAGDERPPKYAEAVERLATLRSERESI